MTCCFWSTSASGSYSTVMLGWSFVYVLARSPRNTSVVPLDPLTRIVNFSVDGAAVAAGAEVGATAGAVVGAAAGAVGAAGLVVGAVVAVDWGADAQAASNPLAAIDAAPNNVAPTSDLRVIVFEPVIPSMAVCSAPSRSV